MQILSYPALPEVVRRHVEAYRNHDLEAYMATLAPAALINDSQREFVGHPAIRGWAEREIFGSNVVLEVLSAFEQYGNPILRCSVDGDFDKSNLPDPLILTYYFAVEEDRITQLIICQNRIDEG